MAMEASEVTEARRLRVWALAKALRSHGYAVEIAESLPLLAVPAACGPPVGVRCDLRAICGGELWFVFAGGGAIAPADDAHIPDAVVAVKGQLAAQADG
ncbi:hypothetical protein [Actinomadura citrea]|jgi:hypothetical protein|uniref:Uncharacterized protein n=1 Tax=Actinomadura citrea TaxID=46158 RepID=A0A7Y9KFI6_9ACTN|nr:hypothetical protein [Actinomadura citrea]NYE17422.1 hypothetical protein [Actinomadura citrea]GGU00893.1 hypothetical protein GCM10010177_70100 [Actinomadura citrea]